MFINHRVTVITLSPDISRWIIGEIFPPPNESCESSIPKMFLAESASIDQHIQENYESVIPLVSGNSPKDAHWVFPSGLRCTSSENVLLLLKFSSRCSEKIRKLLNFGEKVNVELRKYLDLNPSMEFRVFFKDNKIKGISQKSISDYFPQLNDETLTTRLKKEVQELEEFLLSRHGSNTTVLDTYFSGSRTENLRKGKLCVIGEKKWRETDSLLFSWEELESNNNLELRIVENDYSRISRASNFSGYPIEILDNENFQGLDSLIQSMEEANRLSDEEIFT
eukprot:GHVP01067961.1.p2 GENE.GHVP01067961.1~~GHVP01067961.1.p2  ORF type:complete len:280 (+),score=47.64 GHVP01067961.1:27-866(+)